MILLTVILCDWSRWTRLFPSFPCWRAGWNAGINEWDFTWLCPLTLTVSFALCLLASMILYLPYCKLSCSLLYAPNHFWRPKPYKSFIHSSAGVLIYDRINQCVLIRRVETYDKMILPAPLTQSQILCFSNFKLHVVLVKIDPLIFQMLPRCFFSCLW